MTQSVFLDVASGTLTKHSEVICGDQVASFKDENGAIVVLADGLGSGVKASVLATITTNIAMTMLKDGASIHSVFETVVGSLPLCKVRDLSYCTLTILQVNANGDCQLYEYDNPQAVVIRSGVLCPTDRRKLQLGDKAVWHSAFRLLVGDRVAIFSDGAIHAGTQHFFNHDWEWPDLAHYLQTLNSESAHYALAHFMMTIQGLYAHKALDDVSCVTLHARAPRHVHILSGPPVDRAQDHQTVQSFMASEGLKVVCGGTTAKVAARELNRSLETTSATEEEGVPPIAFIEGIDLVTEGVITLNHVCALFEVYASNPLALEGRPLGGAMRLCQIMIHEATHIHFWIGCAENRAHTELTLDVATVGRRPLVRRLEALLLNLGKQVTTRFH